MRLLLWVVVVPLSSLGFTALRLSRHTPRLRSSTGEDDSETQAPPLTEEEGDVEQQKQRKQFDVSTLSSRQKIANMRQPPKELLSEAWKESEEEAASLAPLLAGASAFLVFLFVAFAQVPVGNDVASFTYDKGQKVLSPQDIAKKYKQLGLLPSESSEEEAPVPSN
mmetsp:Transcript_10459/g.34540  ORF Transcript_10459/g.34540 Transcript_10459/m.34540 type:complete len:166 (-) Transcript_10459:336-833(-)